MTIDHLFRHSTTATKTMTEDVTKQQQTSGNDNDENHENEMSSVEEEQEDKSQKTEQSSSQDSSSSPHNDNHEQTAPQTRFNFYTAQVAEEIRRETSQDSIGANSEKSTPPLSKKPNRFHFYNAAEVGPVQVISSINTKNNCKRTSSQPSPTMATESSVEVTSLRSPSLPREISSSQQKEVDSNEILRSLQETERQQHPRRSSLIAARKQCTPTPRSNKTTTTTNPYETAIKEALQMLQSNSVGTPDNIPQQPQDEDDVVMQMRKTETSPSTTKKERAWRKERIAKYASRFDEMNTSGNEQAEGGVEQALPTSGHNTKMATSWTPPTPGEAYNNPNAEALYRLRSESDDIEATPQSVDMQPLLDTSLEQEATDVTSVHSTNSQVQKGVEQVLLAILERANSSTTDKQQQQTVNTKNELDALTHAMENLLQPSLSFETVSTVRSRRPNRRESEQQALDDLQSTTTTTTRVESSCQVPVRKASVVEELLQDSFRNNKVPDETKDSSFEEEHTDFVESSSSTELLVDESQQSIEVVESSDVFDEEREDTSGSTSSSYPDEEEDAFEEEELETRTHDAVNTSVDESTLTHLLGKLRRMSDADREEGEDSEDDKNVLEDESVLTNVLGPLSHRAGGTTGVVLETASYEEEPPPPPDGEDDDSAPLSPASIYETLSSAVKDAESFMSYISGGYPAVKDKYSTCDEEEATMVRGPPPDGSSGDHVTDAHELMRSLCAHLLPYGVDKSAESPKLERIPMWDESNPDEAGYRIIRLSKRQLRAVELEFDNMVKSVKQTSERDLNGSLSKTDANEDWNGVPDDVFARDLEEAEELLDQEEKHQDEADRAKARADPEESDEDESDEATSSSGSGSSESGTMETTRSPLLSDDDDTLLTSHPDFPGVKTTGRGEIGDLEYFHLPIIYKSHVTGFEPTKDLFLEPGNVVAGQYLVENELGSAAFSTAYRCIDLSSEMKTTEKGEEVQEEVCLKVIKNTKDFFDQSLDEIKILELLRQTGKCHENHVLEMKTFFYHREHLIIVTELLRQNLFEFGKFIRDSDEEPYFTRTRLCYITRQVLIALNFIHKMGLVHSDVKPENILLGSYCRAQVKLIDFGSSCYLTDRQSSYIQSRSYRAPEVVLGLPYDGKIDMWSLGCVVAEMYTGEVTFQNDSIVSMLSRIEAICGPFPRHMIAQGRQSGRFFTKSGLLYEHVDADSNTKGDVAGDNSLLDVFQPKRTTLAARLGIPDIETEEEALFVDFCSKLLAVDPDSRPSAADALKHPWIVAGESITEEDIKYPSK